MPRSWVGETIGGRYQVEALLGQGGMSAVYRANDPNLRRPVAVKLIHTHLSDDPNFVGRFKEEAAAVARLRHPNIVQVHDFNSDGDTYYMVMEFLVGETLQARLKRLNTTGRRLPLDEAVRLCLQVCDAAGYAHSRELIHRDIKPANIMLNVNGQAILMDFGIVKIVGGDYHTATGATVGTAMYMPPEQIRAERADERSDVYSLGITLYEMISGRPPFLADSAMALMMMVLNDPLPPLDQYRQDVPASLRAVVEKALAKDAAQRFQSMAEMRAALQEAQAELENALPTPADTVADEAKARPAAPSPPQAEPARAAPAVVEREPAPPGPPPPSAEAAGAPAAPNKAAPAPSLPAAKPKRALPRLGGGLRLAVAGLVVLVIAVTAGLVYLNISRPPQVALAPILRPPQPVTDQTASAVVGLGVWELDADIDALCFSPEGWLATANNREAMRFSPYRFYAGLWDMQAGSLRRYLRGNTQWLNEVAFSPDGQLVTAASEDGRLRLWQAADGTLVREIENPSGGLTSVAFSPNGLLLGASTWDGSVNLWQVSNGQLLRTLQENEDSLRDLAFSPDGALVAAASDGGYVLVWQVSDGTLVRTLTGHSAQVYRVAFSPDGTLLASASEDGTLKVWRVGDGSPVFTLAGHTEPVFDAAFSPDGSLLASGSVDGTVRLWHLSDGTPAAAPLAASDGVKRVAFSPDGYWLVSATADHKVQFWGLSEAILPGGS